MNVKRIFAIAISAVPLLASAQITLEQCQQWAEQNYPLVKQYDLVTATTDINVNNIAKGWLPQITATGQATYQSGVTKLPDTFYQLLEQYGVSYKGMSKLQYKAQIDVDQTVWDGGRISAKQGAARAEGEVNRAQIETDMYEVRSRVNDLFFSLLLVQDQINLNTDLQKLLNSSCEKLGAMVKGGTAMKSDYNAVKAELLKAEQNETELKSTESSLRQVLSIFTGNDCSGQLVKPAASEPASYNVARPELKLMDAKIAQLEQQNEVLDANLRPRLSVFGQGYFGYAGYNMFKSMRNHDPSFNGMVGVRLQWNIGALYTRKGDKNKLKLQQDLIESQRETFLLNNRMQSAQDDANVQRYRKVMAQDSEIISLREQVRSSAEYKLQHGTILVNDLLREITNENEARINKSMHEVQLLQAIYSLKNTVNQ